MEASLYFPGWDGRTLRTVTGSAYIPKHAAKYSTNNLGEDAHFFSDKYRTIGVADGVGEWASKFGIDGGEYARQLMYYADLSVCVSGSVGSDVDPSAVVREAFSATWAQGSSTACVLTLKQDNLLHCFNVGDSGFVVIREGEIVYRSPVQKKRFNCPFQLGHEQDDPSVGEEFEVEIEVGDIIVAGTNGLFDNVFDHEIECLVDEGMDKMEIPEALARRIANFALHKAKDSTCDSPFEINAWEAMFTGYRGGRWKAGFPGYKGGRYDDITVVVSVVVPA